MCNTIMQTVYMEYMLACTISIWADVQIHPYRNSSVHKHRCPEDPAGESWECGSVWCVTAKPLDLGLSPVVLPGEMTQDFTDVPSDLKSCHSFADIPGWAWLLERVTANPCLACGYWELRLGFGQFPVTINDSCLADAGKSHIRYSKSLLLILGKQLCWECFC